MGLYGQGQLSSQKSIAPQTPSFCLLWRLLMLGVAVGWGLGVVALSSGTWWHRHHLPPHRDPAGHKAPHCCDSSWVQSDGDAWVLPTQRGAWLMEEPAVKHPCPVRPHALVGWGHPIPCRSPGFPPQDCLCAWGQAGAWQLHQLPAETGGMS